jgi:hypothetical protein
LYGVSLRSEWSLPYPRTPASCLAEIDLLQGSPKRFADAVSEARVRADQTTWARGVPLGDSQTYLQWSERFEFLVSADGRAIAARRLRHGSNETFHTYLLGQALSFALIKQGLDPLHATTVAIDGAAIAFLGDSGYGKSSLGAAFVQAGHQLLTDDLLVLSERDAGFAAHPGPPRIKLFPKIARQVLGRAARGTPIGPMTPKLVIRLDDHQASRSARPLTAIYVLTPPASDGRVRTRVTIRRLSRRQACLALLRNTFNTAVTDPGRLSRQFAFAASVAAAVPVKLIAYPRTLRLLPAVRDAILADTDLLHT